MGKLLHFTSILLVLVGVALIFEHPAYAYADPGTGLLAVQAVGSMLVATGWYLRRKIYTLFHRSAKPATAEFQSVEHDEGSPLS
jgi:O-antigen/teichoic acid export membrane protein